MALEIECVDRLLLNAYVPGYRFPVSWSGSCAAISAIGSRRGVARSDRRSLSYGDAQVRACPPDNVLRPGSPDRSRWDDRKLTSASTLRRAEREGRFGVVALVVAEEFQRVWSRPYSSAASQGSRAWSSSGRSVVSAPTTSTSSTRSSGRRSSRFDLRSVVGEDLGQRTRVGQAPSAARRARFHRAAQRIRIQLWSPPVSRTPEGFRRKAWARR